MYSFGQTFVSTTPSNKNVILEEYTGTNCVFCPDGHKIAQQLVTANPDRFLLLISTRDHLQALTQITQLNGAMHLLDKQI